jgi:hypothetical protein
LKGELPQAVVYSSQSEEATSNGGSESSPSSTRGRRSTYTVVEGLHVNSQEDNEFAPPEASSTSLKSNAATTSSSTFSFGSHKKLGEVNDEHIAIEDIDDDYGGGGGALDDSNHPGQDDSIVLPPRIVVVVEVADVCVKVAYIYVYVCTCVCVCVCTFVMFFASFPVFFQFKSYMSYVLGGR